MKDPKGLEMPQKTPGRPRRNAAATRQAILDSARQAFTRSGYDGVGLREIAQSAGVTAMLVNRYFGSKGKLFEEVVETTLAVPGILRNEITKADNNFASLSRALASELVAAASDRSPLDGILLLVRSAANEQAALVLRESAARHLKPLMDIMTGSHADERAATFLALVAGFQLMRWIIALPGLAEADPTVLEGQLEELFACLLTEK